MRIAEALDIPYTKALQQLRDLRDSHPDMTGKRAADLLIESAEHEDA